MGYAVHIRRSSGRIELAEWVAFADAASDLQLHASQPSQQAEGESPVYTWSNASFVWRDGEVVIDDMADEWRKKLGDVADRLGAEAIGDDGERYLSDGRVDYGEGPQSVHGIRTMASFRYAPIERVEKRSKVGIVAVGIVLLVVAALLLLLRR